MGSRRGGGWVRAETLRIGETGRPARGSASTSASRQDVGPTRQRTWRSAEPTRPWSRRPARRSPSFDALAAL